MIQRGTLVALTQHPKLGPLRFSCVRFHHDKAYVTVEYADGRPLIADPDFIPGKVDLRRRGIDDVSWTAESVNWTGLEGPLRYELPLAMQDFFVDCAGGKLERPTYSKAAEAHEHWLKHRESGQILAFTEVRFEPEESFLHE